MRGAFTCLLALILPLTGCFVYSVQNRSVRAGESAELFLNAEGRSMLTATIGPRIRVLAGRVNTLRDSSIDLSVESSRSLEGNLTQWNGEPVTVAMQLVDSVRVRTFSKRRTALATATAILTVAGLRALFGLQPGGSEGPGSPPTPQ